MEIEPLSANTKQKTSVNQKFTLAYSLWHIQIPIQNAIEIIETYSNLGSIRKT